MSTAATPDRALADNLIDTLGPFRAEYVAKQFGWYGVAEIIREVSELSPPGNPPY